MARTVRCTVATRTGRKAKALQFHEAAGLITDAVGTATDLADAFVTLLVHAGVAAADVLCCARLGEHAIGDNHAEAVALLARVDKRLAADLGMLLGMKTRAGYDHRPVGAEDRRRAQRAAARLVDAARLV